MEIPLQCGSIFLMNGLILPPGLRFEGQPYSEGWRFLSGSSPEIDGHAHGCGWNFIFLAEVIRRTAFGFSRGWSLRTATNKILAEARTNAFNCVELTGISEHQFLGVYWVTVSAHSRSLQKGQQVRDLLMRRRELSMEQCVPGAERL